MFFDIIDYSLFQSAISDLNLTEEGVPLSDCGDYKASICKLMPPLMESEEQVQTISSGADIVQGAINLVTTGNLLIAILMSATLQ